VKKHLNGTPLITKRPFVYEVAFTFEAKRRSQTFGKEKNNIYCSRAPLFTAFATQGKKKQSRAPFTCFPLVSVNLISNLEIK